MTSEIRNIKKTAKNTKRDVLRQHEVNLILAEQIADQAQVALDQAQDISTLSQVAAAQTQEIADLQSRVTGLENRPTPPETP